LNNNAEALLFKTGLLDCEIYHSNFGGDFGSIVWVWHACGDEKEEIFVVVDFLITNPN